MNALVSYRPDTRCYRQTDEIHSYNPLKLYEGGFKKKQGICKSERTAENNLFYEATIFKRIDMVQLDTKARCVTG